MMSDVQMQIAAGNYAAAIHASSHDSGVPATSGVASQAPLLVQPSTRQVISSPADPSISRIVQLAKDSLQVPAAVFCDYVIQAGGATEWSAFMGNSSEQQSFVQAFTNGTLTVRNASSIAGLDYQDNSVLTGTSESVSNNMNTAWMSAQHEIPGTYSMGLMTPQYLAA